MLVRPFTATIARKSWRFYRRWKSMPNLPAAFIRLRFPLSVFPHLSPPPPSCPATTLHLRGLHEGACTVQQVRIDAFLFFAFCLSLLLRFFLLPSHVTRGWFQRAGYLIVARARWFVRWTVSLFLWQLVGEIFWLLLCALFGSIGKEGACICYDLSGSCSRETLAKLFRNRWAIVRDKREILCGILCRYIYTCIINRGIVLCY